MTKCPMCTRVLEDMDADNYFCADTCLSEIPKAAMTGSPETFDESYDADLTAYVNSVKVVR